MEKTSYISIKDPNERYNDFVRFMATTTDELKKSAATGRVDYSKHQGEKLEWVVLDQMKSLANQFNFCPENIVHTERQHFPDIISEKHFGVEVKATKEKTWTSTGSSITESLREDCVKKIFLLFGRLSIPEVDFRCKPYEDCMSDISVTHNPRYLIKMDLDSKNQTIFEKLGVPYDDFRIHNNRIDIIRNYYREKYKNNGKEMPWWIGEDPENSRIEDRGIIRLYSTTTKEEKDYLKLCGFILFPEVLKSSYKKLALWLCSRHSIVNPNIRDMYSAGGKMKVYIDGKLYKTKVPKSIANFLAAIDNIRDVFYNQNDIYNEISYYSEYSKNDNNEFSSWKSVVNQILKEIIALDVNAIFQLTVECTLEHEIRLNTISSYQKQKYQNLLDL